MCWWVLNVSFYPSVCKFSDSLTDVQAFYIWLCVVKQFISLYDFVTIQLRACMFLWNILINATLPVCLRGYLMICLLWLFCWGSGESSGGLCLKVGPHVVGVFWGKQYVWRNAERHSASAHHEWRIIRFKAGVRWLSVIVSVYLFPTLLCSSGSLQSRRGAACSKCKRTNISTELVWMFNECQDVMIFKLDWNT